MDRDWYINECLRKHNDTKFYRQLDIDQTSDIQTRIQFYIKRLHKDNSIDDKTKRFLIQTDPKPGRFYILPKIHKQGNPGPYNGHPTERISQFVDYHLKPLVHKTASFIKDRTHFLNKLDQLGHLRSNAILVTLDVSSLYTNIPHNEGIDACRHFFDTHDRSTSTMSKGKYPRMIFAPVRVHCVYYPYNKTRSFENWGVSLRYSPVVKERFF